MKLDDPLRVGVGHDITFFPEESAVTSLDLPEDDFNVKGCTRGLEFSPEMK